MTFIQIPFSSFTSVARNGSLSVALLYNGDFPILRVTFINTFPANDVYYKAKGKAAGDRSKAVTKNTHHFTSHFLWDICFHIETELYCFIVFVLPFQLLGIFYPKSQSQRGMQPILLFLCQLHSESRVFRKESMVQEVFDGQPEI